MTSPYEDSGGVSLDELLDTAQELNDVISRFNVLDGAEGQDDTGVTYIVRPLGGYALEAQQWNYQPFSEQLLPQSPRRESSIQVTADDPFEATHFSTRQKKDGTIEFEFSRQDGSFRLRELVITPEQQKQVAIERMLAGQMLSRWTADSELDAVVAGSFGPDEE